ncbi:uncharacterized protein LOC144769202 [Lissotriton helveticus]
MGGDAAWTLHPYAPPKGKRSRTQEEEEEGAVQEDAGQDRAGEGSFAGPSGTSGGGASAEVAVLGEDSEDSGEDAVQEPADGPVGVRTVVAGTVAPSKSTSRREQARMARQRRLDATVAEYRRLVALEEEEDTQSTGATTTSSTGTAASSSVTPRAASMRSDTDVGLLRIPPVSIKVKDNAVLPRIPQYKILQALLQIIPDLIKSGVVEETTVNV